MTEIHIFIELILFELVFKFILKKKKLQNKEVMVLNNDYTLEGPSVRSHWTIEPISNFNFF